MKKPHRVVISFDPETKKISVTDYSPDLSRKDGDTVEWESDQDFLVCFGNNSPFTKKHFYRGHGNSGSVNADAALNFLYKYSIEMGGVTLDPGVIIIE